MRDLEKKTNVFYNCLVSAFHLTAVNVCVHIPGSLFDLKAESSTAAGDNRNLMSLDPLADIQQSSAQFWGQGVGGGVCAAPSAPAAPCVGAPPDQYCLWQVGFGWLGLDWGCPVSVLYRDGTGWS